MSDTGAGWNAESPGLGNAIEIPWRELSTDALDGLIEAFVMREGTDYGEHEATMADKIEQVRCQIHNEQVRVLFDADTESVTLVTAETLARHSGISSDHSSSL